MSVARRMGDYLAVAAEMPTGFGPTVWVGELRKDGKPVWESIRYPLHYGDQHTCYPMTLGRTADEVFAGLQTRAARLKGAAA